MMIEGVRINISPAQIFDFTTKVKGIMYELLHEESFLVVTQNMIDFVVRSEYETVYSSALRVGLDSNGRNVFDLLNMSFDIVKPEGHMDYLLGFPQSFVPSLELDALHKKMIEVIPEVQDWSTSQSLSAGELEIRLQDWNNRPPRSSDEMFHEFITVELTQNPCFLPLYAELNYSGEDWSRFWEQAFDNEAIFTAAVRNSIQEMLKIQGHSVSLVHYDDFITASIQELYKQHPEYVDIPYFNIEFKNSYEPFPQIQNSIPKEWLENVVNSMKDTSVSH